MLIIYFTIVYFALALDDDMERCIVSISDSSIKPSDYINALDVFKGGLGVDDNINSDKISVDKNKLLSLGLTSTNADIASDLGILDSVSHDDLGISHNQFYLNYTIASNKRYSSNRASTYDPNNNDYQVGCNIISNRAELNITTVDNPKLISFVSYSYAVFAIADGDLGAYYIQYYSGKIDKIPLYELIEQTDTLPYQYLSSILYSNLWVIDQLYDERVLLVMKDKTKNSFYFYNITLLAGSIGEIYDNKVKLTYVTKIYMDDGEFVFNNLGIFREDILIGTDKGLFIYRKEKDDNYELNRLIKGPYKENSTTTDFSVASGLSDSNNNVNTASVNPTNNNEAVVEDLGQSTNGKVIYLSDFSVNELTIYLVFNGYGLVILDPNKEYELQDWYFRHPYLLNLDFINNPFFGNKFTGITIKNQNQITEFYLELLTDNEFHPFLNKVFVSDEIIMADNAFMPDLFYTYIFNKIEKNIIIIRRGLINAVATQTLVVKLQNYGTLTGFFNNPVIPIYDLDRQIIISAVYFENKLALINDIIDDPDSLACYFTKSGEYIVTYTSSSEVCNSNISSNFVYSFCKKAVSFQYNVIGDDTSEYDILIGIFIAIFGLIFVSIVTWFLRKTSCCSNFKAFKVKKQRVYTREELYHNSPPKREYKANQQLNEPIVITKNDKTADEETERRRLDDNPYLDGKPVKYENGITVTNNRPIMRKMGGQKVIKAEAVTIMRKNAQQSIHVLDDAVRSPDHVIIANPTEERLNDINNSKNYDYDNVNVRASGEVDVQNSPTVKRRKLRKKKETDGNNNDNNDVEDF
jgi:hypothetical protein